MIANKRHGANTRHGHKARGGVDELRGERFG